MATNKRAGGAVIYASGDEWRESPRKRVMLFGMSGLGKTYLSSILRGTGAWFHYSVDYRIGTRYMNEHITDAFKREAMRLPLLRELLMSDSIYVGSNITFDNLAPLSAYLGKPGNPEKGGLPFETYMTRQSQHRSAEIAATLDAVSFAEKTQDIYGYQNFICDTSGSICEVVSPEDPNDPVLSRLSQHMLMIWLRGSQEHTAELIRRFDKAPKPMYYQTQFLGHAWKDYCREKGLNADQVDPDAFVRHIYAKALDNRHPRYRAIADNWGITIDAHDAAKVKTAQDFELLIARALDNHRIG